jgi:hypothetical protein
MTDQTSEYDIFYTAISAKNPNDVGYLAQIAQEIQIGIRKLVITSSRLNAGLEHSIITVEPIQRFEENKFVSGVHINARVKVDNAI